MKSNGDTPEVMWMEKAKTTHNKEETMEDPKLPFSVILRGVYLKEAAEHLASEQA